MSSGGTPSPGDTPKRRPHPPGRRATQPLNPFDRLRQDLQYLLDCEGDGWQLAHYVVVLGIQKLSDDGHIQNASWIAVPIDQADYITDGLIESAEIMRSGCDVEDD